MVFPNGGSGSASGPAGGDLSGTYPNPTVAQVQGDANVAFLDQNGVFSQSATFAGTLHATGLILESATAVITANFTVGGTRYITSNTAAITATLSATQTAGTLTFLVNKGTMPVTVVAAAGASYVGPSVLQPNDGIWLYVIANSGSNAAWEVISNYSQLSFQTITTPPVSGTAYQNTTGDNMWLSILVTLNVIASVSGASPGAILAISPDGVTYTSVSYVGLNGVTTPALTTFGETPTLYALVPDKWFYKVTTFGGGGGATVTLGAAVALS